MSARCLRAPLCPVGEGGWDDPPGTGHQSGGRHHGRCPDRWLHSHAHHQPDTDRPVAIAVTHGDADTDPQPRRPEARDAKARVVLLWQTLDGLLVDSSRSINELDTLASGEALSSLQVMLTTVRQRGQVQVGATKIPSQSALAKGDGWVVTSCVDRSEAILTDKAGQPVTPAPQPRLSHESTVQLVGANLQITKDEVLGSC